MISMMNVVHGAEKGTNPNKESIFIWEILNRAYEKVNDHFPKAFVVKICKLSCLFVEIKEVSAIGGVGLFLE